MTNIIKRSSPNHPEIQMLFLVSNELKPSSSVAACGSYDDIGSKQVEQVVQRGCRYKALAIVSASSSLDPLQE